MLNWFSSLIAVKWVVGSLVLLLIIFFANIILKHHGKMLIFMNKVRTPIGELTIEDIDQEADSVTVLTQPVNSDQMPFTLPDIKVKVYNKANRPLKGKQVTVTLKESVTYKERTELQGTLTRTTGRDGCAVFKNLIVKKRGAFYLDFEVDGIMKNSKVFQITAPGVDTDYMGKRYGTEEYYDALKTAVSLSKKNSEQVFINNEEV